MHRGPDPECYGCGHPTVWKEGVYCEQCRKLRTKRGEDKR